VPIVDKQYSSMQWGPIRDRLVEGRHEGVRCWLLMNRESRVMGIYIKIEEVSKFVPEDEWEETLEGAKFRAEFEVERYFTADRIAKLNSKNRV
jgi:hypothetical protein